MVYQILDRNGLCDYYTLNDRPGISQHIARRPDKFAFLDDPKIAAKLISFQNEEETHVMFYLPQVHCSSCLYLLENLRRLDRGVISSRVDFAAKKATLVFDHRAISLRRIADLLTAIGYEPYISLHELGQVMPQASRQDTYRLGITGFCFANIMLISFPEYLGLDGTEPSLQTAFRTIDLILALPVLLYSAQPFYRSAWKGLRHKFLNIDAPIALAILVTFARSVYEVLAGAGGGYFDSMSGIVFFMLAGRALQDRTYRLLSFERDYTSYFPVAVSVLKDEKELPRSLPDIMCGDTLRIHHEELIPADGILTRGQALIDYSFVTGESLPVLKEVGELVYAGGKQTGAAIELLVVKEVAQSYLTQLWNRTEKYPSLKAAHSREEHFSFVHLLSRHFTYIVLAIAAGAALYWWSADPSRIGNAVTAVLIIACPCALLLSATFTNGNILRVLARNRFYLRSPQVIENIAATDHIVFDKTGTLSMTRHQDMVYEGTPLTLRQQYAVATLAAQSSHPLSKALVRRLASSRIDASEAGPDPAPQPGEGSCRILGFREATGRGIEGWVDGQLVAIGSESFVNSQLVSIGSPSFPTAGPQAPTLPGTRVYIAVNRKIMGHYNFIAHYREGIAALANTLSATYPISVLSGDSSRERTRLQDLMGTDTALHFGQSPHDKTRYIKKLQQRGARVMMIGDGLNDAGALRQSDTGIALSESGNPFTPASDAILDSRRLYLLPAFIRYCRAEKKIVMTSFAVSILYNIIGLSFAVRGALSPMVAAILMPSSSLTIFLLTYGCSNLAARWLRLRRNPEQDQPGV